MKNLILLISISIIFYSCEKNSLDEGFENANPNVKEKLIKQIDLIFDDWQKAEGTIRINYNQENKITSIASEKNTHFFYYNKDGDLILFKDDSEDFLIDDLFKEIGDSAVAAYTWGDVLRYDSNGNPEEVELLKGSFDYHFSGIEEYSIAYISYDPIPNPFYYTLKAGGIIDVLDNIYLNFGYGPKELILAKDILPFNFPNQILVKNIHGATEFQYHFDNTIDEDDYLIRSDVLFISKNDATSSILKFMYE